MYKILLLLPLLLESVATAETNRYWAQFPIGYISEAAALPTAGGAGSGLRIQGSYGTTEEQRLKWLHDHTITAKAVVRVEDAQSITWEWIGIEVPAASFELTGFPNLTLAVDGGAASREYSLEPFDLNPIAPNIWGTTSTTLLDMPEELQLEGTYESFAHSTEFSTTLKLHQGRVQATANRVDFSTYPEELAADVSFAQIGGTFSYTPVAPVVLEPLLNFVQYNGRLGRYVDDANQVLQAGFANHPLIHTPTGDANNDGKVSFDDFLILSGNFQVAEAARWDDGDFDEDGDVDFGDFLSLSANFNSGVAAVPEPSGGMLMVLGGVVAAARRRRRCGRISAILNHR